MDRAADAAARRGRCGGGGSGPGARRVLRQLLYHLGRWVYLVDAADDLKKDVKSGSYNPLVYRFHTEGGTLTADDKGRRWPLPWAPSGPWPQPLSWRTSGPWRSTTSKSCASHEGLYAVGAEAGLVPSAKDTKENNERQAPDMPIPTRCWACLALRQMKKAYRIPCGEISL